MENNLRDRLVNTRRGWYYISAYRKMKNNALWVGPYKNELEALRELESDPRESTIWLVCPACRDNPSACDSRPFKVTRAELASADGFILCEYCGARCIEIDTPKH